MKKKYIYKVLIAGEGGVGKTTLINRAVNNTFSVDTSMTIGIQFDLLYFPDFPNPYNPEETIEVCLQLWDFGGQERFRFMLDSYVVGAKSAFLVYDLTRVSSLASLDSFVKLVRLRNKEIPIMLLGSKLDKTNEFEDVEPLVSHYTKKTGFIDHIKVSSKNGTGVQMAFHQMTALLLELNGVISPPKGMKSIHAVASQQS